MTEQFIPPGLEFLRPKEVDGETMQHDLYVCAAFDPGETTGWAVFGAYMIALRSPEYNLLENIAFWSAGQFNVGDETAQARQMLKLCRAWPNAHRVVEQFVLRKLIQDESLLSPVRVTAKFDLLLGEAFPGNNKYILQQAPLAMTTITDDRLKSWGYWTPLEGKVHARDAVRHALTWLRRAKDILAIHTKEGK